MEWSELLRKAPNAYEHNCKTLQRYVKLQIEKGITESASFGYIKVHQVVHLSWIQMTVWTLVILTAEAVRITMNAPETYF
jgi:hypothetical protein